MPKPRMFIDTNVLVSAVLFGGVPGRVIDAAREGAVHGVVSLHVLSEFIEVLSRERFGVDPATAVALAEEIARFTEVVPLTAATGSWVSDGDDDPVVEAAHEGHATYLVTGDTRIHQADAGPVEVISPAAAVRLIDEIGGA